jgi:hypothetical protein
LLSLNSKIFAAALVRVSRTSSIAPVQKIIIGYEKKTVISMLFFPGLILPHSIF